VKADEVGTVNRLAQGVARVEGLPRAKSEELLRFTGNLLGTVFNVDPSAWVSFFSIKVKILK
jgi:F0F1-type ATP synthase alpha subunit